MSSAKWILIAACLVTACSSGSSSGKGDSTTTTPDSKTGTISENAWKEVAQGVVGKKAWKVASAKSSTGWRCFDPTGSALPAAGDTATAAGPARQGRRSQCLPPASEATEPPFVAFVDGADGNQWVVVGAVADGVKKVSLVYGDGTATPLNIDPKSRLVIWKGPSSVRPKQIRTDNATCAIAPTASTDVKTLCAGVQPAPA